MDSYGLFILFIAVLCVSYAQKQSENQHKRNNLNSLVNRQYRYGSRFGNQRSGIHHPFNKQPYRSRVNQNGFGTNNRLNRYNGNFDQSLGYGNYLRQIGAGYPQTRSGLRNPLYGAGSGFQGYKTGYPLHAQFPGYLQNYAPLPVAAPSLYGYNNYQVDKWGEWGSWSACSRSCDGGVQERTRRCQTSKLSMTLSLYKGQGHQHGKCPGFGKEFQSCNTSPCISVKSFEDQKYEARKQQCSKFDKKDYLGQKYTWMPYIRDGLNECRLYCMAKGFRMFVELAKSVNDGTLCGKHGNSACYNGTCSKKRHKAEISKTQKTEKANAQRPGVNGDLLKASKQQIFVGQQDKSFLTLENHNNLQSYRSAAMNHNRQSNPPLNPQLNPQLRTFYPRINKKIQPRIGFKPQVKSNRLVTRKVSGMFNSKAGLKLGYNEIFKIPIGATNIRIQEARPSENYLAMKVDDKYLVNGLWSIVLRKDIRAAGTLIKYRLNRGPKSTEIITAAGPTTKELKIVIFIGQFICLNGSTPICYQGSYTSIPSLLRRVNRPYNCSSTLLYQEGPPEIFFNYTIKLPESRRNKAVNTAVSFQGNNRNRARTKPTLHWSVAGWTKCSRPCGGGEQQLNVRCVAIYPGRQTKVVKSSYCQSLKKPGQRKRVCNMRPCKPTWKLLPWKPCSKTCGYGGYQQREVQCMRLILTSRGKVEISAPFYECGRRPAIRKECPYVPCYSWRSDPWSSCSRTCDKGTQSRKTYCVSDDKITDEFLCDSREKPDTLQMCNLRPCKADWFIGKWSKCSAFCGEGSQNRLVFCAGKDGSSLPDFYCRNHEKPSQSRICINRNCNGIWLTSNWTQCSRSCGDGERSRMVLCFSMQNGSMKQTSKYHCDYHTKPKAKEICNLGECQPEWFTTEWSQCSATCGRGIKTRIINCMMRDGKQGRGCQIETRPDAAMICNVKPCVNEIEGRTGQQKSRRVLKTSTKEVKETKGPLLEARKLSTDRNTDQSESTASKSAIRFAKAKVSALDKTVRVSNVKNKETIPVVKTTIRTTTTAVKTTLAKKPQKKVEAKCKNTHKRAYCAVIVRIGFCKFTTYRNRCCATCSGVSR